MDQVKARLIGLGAGATAEVVVCFGEGPNKRSVTRHIKKMDGKWWGRNPDEPAVARLVAAERVEAATIEVYNDYSGKLSAIKDRLQSLKDTKIAAKKEGIILDLQEFGDITEGLRVNMRILTPYVAGLGHAMKIAKESANALRKTTPAEVEFVF